MDIEGSIRHSTITIFEGAIALFSNIDQVASINKSMLLLLYAW